jgi:uncharacterized membrane protein YgaE (UPF0421/DUF939 family)
MTRDRTAGALSQALGRARDYAWPLLQGTVAATLAWAIAKYGLDHAQPFFAPVAAVVALNTTLGERGLNAVRLLEGVMVGIIVGELTIAAFEGGYGALALAIFTATIIAAALGGTRIVIAQAAVAAILTVAIASPEAGVQRLIDALVGAGVALIFSQLLFAPEPVALVRRAAAAALADMAAGLRLTARALEAHDDEVAERALVRLREVRDRLAELARMRAASSRVARRSAVWRSRRAPVVRENENTGYLDLLGGSCLVMSRAALATNQDERAILAPEIAALADILSDLATRPGDRDVRQRAVDRAMAVSRRAAAIGSSASPLLEGASVMIRMVTADVMSFCGVAPGEAFDAVQEGVGEFDIPTPPPTPRTPFGQRGR